MSSTAFATDSSVAAPLDSDKIAINTVTKTNEVSTEIFSFKEKASKIKDDIEYNLDCKLDSLNNKVVVPSKEELKDKLLKHFNKNAQKQSENIKNIDSIVDGIIKYFENTKGNDLVAQDFRLYTHWHYWSTEPYLVSHTHNISYATDWIGIDCYRSSVSGTKSNSETKTITYKLGLNGATEIKDFLKLTGSWEYTESASSTVSQGTTCPAWTVCWWRPYSRWEEDNYQGSYSTEYYDINGNLVTQGEGKYLSNKIPKDEMTEFASRENTSHNASASTPSAPSGAPNAWW